LTILTPRSLIARNPGYEVPGGGGLEGLSLAGFKDCFKGVYGMPPYGYLKSCRMERASELLLSGDLPIADIAGIVGYDSPSKFTAAFKESMGLTPTAYRLHEGKRG